MTFSDKHNPTQRFSHTVDNYLKYRPTYPAQSIKILQKHCDLTHRSVVADIGCGTGIWTKLLLENGNPVFGVEPNEAMRLAAEKYLAEFKNFISVDAPAENTTLPDHSVDLITAAQAFHWFDKAKVKKEFARILKPTGTVVLIWNLRLSDHSPLMRAYENLLQKYGINYKEVCAERVYDEEIIEFFKPRPVKIFSLDNSQVFDWDSLRGRLLSTSYVPKSGQPGFDEMLQDAQKIFDAHQTNNTVTFLYETKIYCRG